MDYISREAALRAVTGAELPGKTADGLPIANGKRSVSDCVRRIKAIPAADVVERKRGKWLTKEYMYGDPDVGIEDMWVERLAEYGDCAYCSECGENAKLDGAEEYSLTNFCPNCGADMSGKWKKEMPKDDGWYWVMTDFFNGHTEILPCYYKAKYNELQTIDDGIACEIFGVCAIMPMFFPEPPKEEI